MEERRDANMNEGNTTDEVVLEYWLRRPNIVNGVVGADPRKKGHRTIAVCLVKRTVSLDAKVLHVYYARGLAILSPTDAYKTKKGMKIARNRAYRAMWGDISDEQIRRPEALMMLAAVRMNWNKGEAFKREGLHAVKQCRHAKLTEFERYEIILASDCKKNKGEKNA